MVAQLINVVGQVLDQVGILGVVPKWLHGVELRSVGRQPFQLQPRCRSRKDLTYRRAVNPPAGGDNEYVIFFSRSNRGRMAQWSKFREVSVDISGEDWAARILVEQVWLPLLVRCAGVDVLLCPNNVCPVLAPCKVVVVVQSLQPSVVPEFRQYTTFLRFVYIHTMTRLSVRRADRIIVVSESTKRDMCRSLRISPARVQVTHELVCHRYSVGLATVQSAAPFFSNTG